MAAAKAVHRQPPQDPAGLLIDSASSNKLKPKPYGKVPRTSRDAGLDEPTNPKRRKVEFDLNSNAAVQKLETPNTSDASKVRLVARSKVKAEIHQALADHKQNDNQGYDRLKVLFMCPDDNNELSDPDVAHLRLYLEVLIGFTRHLGRSCDGLVKNILKYPWLDKDQSFTRTYTDFLANLLLTQGNTYTELVFSMLVGKFREERGDSIISSKPAFFHDLARKRLHTTINSLLQNFPLAASVLRSVITHKYPFPDDPKRLHIAYVTHLLRMQSYAAHIKDHTLRLIFERVLQLDVRMQLDLQDFDDELAVDVHRALEHSRQKQENGAVEGDDSDIDLDVSDDEDQGDQAKKIYSLKSNVEKLDSILNILFKHYESRISDPMSDEAFEVYGELLEEFVDTILVTCKSRHTQFLLFHFGQKSERLVDAFCGTCLNIAMDSNRPVRARQSAIAYLASFVARGSNVSKKVIRALFDMIGEQVNKMRVEHAPTCEWPDVQRYPIFYAYFQALVYMWCFRWKDLVLATSEPVDPEDPLTYIHQSLTWYPGVRETFGGAVVSPLNPLKVCAPHIVEEFSHMSWRLEFVYVHHIVERNKRFRLSHYSTRSYSSYSAGALRETTQSSDQESAYLLDAFFPFDPYQLPISKQWVEGEYRKWEGFPRIHGESNCNDDVEKSMQITREE